MNLQSVACVGFGLDADQQLIIKYLQERKKLFCRWDQIYKKQLFYCVGHYYLLCLYDAQRICHYRWLLNFERAIWEGKCSDPMYESWCIKPSLVISVLTADLAWWMFYCHGHAEGGWVGPHFSRVMIKSAQCLGPFTIYCDKTSVWL